MTKRLSMNLPDKTAAELEEMAEESGQTATAVVTKAILNEHF